MSGPIGMRDPVGAGFIKKEGLEYPTPPPSGGYGDVFSPSLKELLDQIPYDDSTTKRRDTPRPLAMPHQKSTPNLNHNIAQNNNTPSPLAMPDEHTIHHNRLFIKQSSNLASPRPLPMPMPNHHTTPLPLPTHIHDTHATQLNIPTTTSNPLYIHMPDENDKYDYSHHRDRDPYGNLDLNPCPGPVQPYIYRHTYTRSESTLPLPLYAPAGRRIVDLAGVEIQSLGVALAADIHWAKDLL